MGAFKQWNREKMTTFSKKKKRKGYFTKTMDHLTWLKSKYYVSNYFYTHCTHQMQETARCIRFLDDNQGNDAVNVYFVNHDKVAYQFSTTTREHQWGKWIKLNTDYVEINANESEKTFPYLGPGPFTLPSYMRRLSFP